MRWFLACKLHVLMNHSGDIVRTVLSNRYTADIKMVEKLVKGMTAKLDVDHGYISHIWRKRS